MTHRLSRSVQVAPSVTTDKSGLPEGNQWRYSEFLAAVQNGKVERVRFAKDGTQLQLTAVDGDSVSCPALLLC